MIPREIDREALFEAALYIHRHGVPRTRQSRHWDVVINGRPYPPKYLISVAGRLRTGKLWPPTRFITTEARDYFTSRGFQVRDKGNGAPERGTITAPSILLTWKDAAAYGYTDILLLSFFSKRTQTHVEHAVRGPKGELSFAKCNVTIRGMYAVLDYEPFAKFNKQQRNELGITRLTFEDNDRTSIEAVEWKRAGDSKFVPCPFEIPQYATGPEPPYTPPKTGSKKVLRPIRERPGQAKFRKKLKAAYDHTCCISGCMIAEALEGAHIDPYRTPASDNVKNGLLLRRDLHALFDAHLIGINPKSRAVTVAASIRCWADYARLGSKPLRRPHDSALEPDSGAIGRHWERFQLANAPLSRPTV